MTSSLSRLLLVSCIALLFMFGCEPAVNEVEEPADEAEFEFRDDGDLYFVRNADTLATIDIEIADTDETRERGLMGREGLPDMSGMLFIFPDENDRGFWMADTPLSLDLIFADSDGEIVNIAKYARPYSPETVESEGPAQYVVEVPAGFADRYGLLSRDRIEWSRN